MIGSLRGTVIERHASGEILLEVGGVGYRVSVTLPTIASVAGGAPLFLFTHQHVREDALVLYGFVTRDERETFEALIGATGVGPKLALSILSVHPPAALRRVFIEDDADALTLVPGVGKRTAQRLLVECKSRLELPDVDLVGDDVADGTPAAARAEVRAALTGLGYNDSEVAAVLRGLPDADDAETLLRDALKSLAGAR
jgi:Holliday junction DNA helicase RuvA